MTPSTTPVLLDHAIQVMLLVVAGLFFLNGHWIVGSIVVMQTAATAYLIYKDQTRPPHEPERNPFQHKAVPDEPAP